MIQVILVIVGFVYVLAVGMYLMSKVDKFREKKDYFSRQEPIEEEKGENSCFAIVYGKEEDAEDLCQLLKKKEIGSIIINDIMFHPDWKNIEYIFALSGSDVDNLSICNIGKKLYQLKGTASICNENENKALFQKAGVITIEKQDQLPESLYNMVFGKEA